MIVIPMAGQSRRFREAGYAQPKFMLPLHGLTVFDHALLAFQAYFNQQLIVLIHAADPGVGDFIAARMQLLGVASTGYQAIPLAAPTDGQASTIAQGLAEVADDGGPLVIFNIDTFRPQIERTLRQCVGPAQGWLEVFHGDGTHWSFVQPDPTPASSRAVAVAEKRRISDLCCSGLYVFDRAATFQEVYAQSLTQPAKDCEGGERYVAPLYQRLITAGARVDYVIIPPPAIYFCGIPAEYNERLAEGPVYDPATFRYLAPRGPL